MELTNKTFFTADLHVFHKNVLKHCNRPWSTVEEMNEGLRDNWNETVPTDGTVFVLGDFSLGGSPAQVIAYLRSLNGRKVLIRGNHDNKAAIAAAFDCWDHYAYLSYSGYNFAMMHFPIHEWCGAHHGSIHLHGHVHGNMQEANKGIRRYDVGVDANDYKPVYIEDIINDASKIKPVIPTYRRGA